jgi:excisionase family DNA binding protein
MTERLLLRPSEAATLLSISERKVYELMQNGTIPSDAIVRIPGFHGARIRADKLREFVDTLTFSGVSR